MSQAIGSTRQATPMEWLNGHHLLCFWLVARDGGVAMAAATLRLAQPTVSGQVHALEDALGESLLEREGRKLALTEMGRDAPGVKGAVRCRGRGSEGQPATGLRTPATRRGR